MDIGERKRIIEQTRRELADEIKQYLVGLAVNGTIILKEDSPKWSGYLLVIPKEKYDEMFEEG